MSFLAPFNMQPFNIPLSLDPFTSLLLEGEGEFVLSSCRETTAVLALNGEGELIPTAGKEITTSGTFEGESTIIFNFGRLGTADMIWNGEGTLVINSESFITSIMEYFGILQPNDQVIINTERYTATKNNINELENFNGNFVNLKEGINEIKFEDRESNRTVLIKIEHKDRFV